MKFNHTINLFLSAFVAFVLVACGSSSGDKDKNSDEFKEAEEESLKEQIEEVVYNIPSPSEIPYLLQATGAEFNKNLINSKDKVDTYLARTDKAALNLGIYASDIGYLSSYEKTQDAIDYLGAAKTLADNLGVIGAFDTQVLKKFEKNISNKDSLALLLNQTVKQTEGFLKDDSRNKLSALVVTGSFVEGLYISTGLIKTYPKDLKGEDRNLVLTPLMRVVLKQRVSVPELVKMLSATEPSESVTAIIADLKLLDQAYTSLNIEEKIKNNRADMVLSDKNLEEITTIVERMRNSITQ